MNLNFTNIIFCIIGEVLLPLGSFLFITIFLLSLIKMFNKDQLNIFNNAQVMSPKDAKAYVKKIRSERIENEFEKLLGYGKLSESNRLEYIKLRNENISVKEILNKLAPKEQN